MKKSVSLILILICLGSPVFGDNGSAVKNVGTWLTNAGFESPYQELRTQPTITKLSIPRHIRPTRRYGLALNPNRLGSSKLWVNPNSAEASFEIAAEKISEVAGPGVGGGGDIVQWSNGRIEIADAYEQLAVFHDSARPVSLRESIEFRDLSRLIKIMGGIDLVPGYASPRVYDESIQYFFVDVIPTDLEICKQGMSYKLDSSDDTKVIRAACTDFNDKNTYLVEDFFRQLTPVEQLVLLYHEDMRRYGVPNGIIAVISRSIRFLIPILEEQLQGNFRVLTQKERNSIRELFSALARVGLFDTSIFGDKKLSNDQFLKLYRLTDYGGWVQSGVPLTQDQKVGIFATYWQTSEEVLLPNEFSLVATNICDYRHNCVLKENQAIIGNVILSNVLVDGKTPVTSFFSEDWGNISPGIKELRLDLIINGAMVSGSGFIIFRIAADKIGFHKDPPVPSDWQIVASGELKKFAADPTGLSASFSFDPDYRYVVRFQGQAHRPSVVVPGISPQSLFVHMRLLGKNGDLIMDSGRVKIVIDKRDPDATLTPFTLINGQILLGSEK